jgi:hypothetical protein
MNPLAGKWFANIEKSHRHANHQFHSATLTVEVSGPMVTLTHEGINMSGKHESGKTVFHADGQEYPVSPQDPSMVMVTRWTGTHVLHSAGRKDGREISAATYAVSEDGKTLTITIGGVDGAGKPFDQTVVFDRG